MADIQTDIQERDSIDFANEPVGRLFRKMFFPTLLGMISMVVLNLADGAFIGHGVGSAGLAAVNIAAPIFNIMTGIGIMFGIGSSIVASIHLSKGNVKAARINITQAFIGSIAFSSLVAVFILTNLDFTCKLFGSSDALVPLAGSYLKWIAMSLPLQMLGMVGGFAVRLDGSPKFSMSCTLVASILNIILDYVFIFPLGLGLSGAARATALSFTISGLIVVLYIVRYSKVVKLYRLRLSVKSAVLTVRNIGYQMKTGFSAMLGEVAVSGAIIVGNFVFMNHLGEDGVAAYGVACYCMPILFMLANSIVQSMQPVMSYAYGVGNIPRLLESRNVALKGAVVAGLLSTLVLGLGSRFITLIFMTPDMPAFDLCVKGFPYFSAGGILIAVNLVLIGYYQSIEKAAKASLLMLLRGFIIVIPVFILLPKVLGVPGMWLAIPLSELLTLLIILLLSLSRH
ncbi:MAG: MATE family efflux transporter [Bacteroidales bacterium]|nr:MATE family efflux transporter [Bacteroidales bacterium]